MAVYYIDLTSGDDTKDGLSTTNAWKTLGKYTTTTTRTAGDIAYVRAGTTQTLSTVDLVFDENGTQAAPIQIIGCDATVNDPWGDTSDVLPVLDFGAAAFGVVLSKNYWIINRLWVKNSTKTSAGMFSVTGNCDRISYCTITGNNAASTSYGLVLNSAGGITYVDHCTVYDNKLRNIQIATSLTAYIDSCTVDGGAATTDFGIYAISGASVYVENSTFGSTTAHDMQDIQVGSGARVYCRNCTFNKTTLALTNFADMIHSEDDDGTFGNNISYYSNGTITKSATARVGGATSSARMLPSSNCGAIFPLSLSSISSPLGADFAIYNTSTAAINIDIYIRSDSAWATPPTNAQLWVEASYLSNASTAARSTVKSTETINADGTTWTAFRCTMTPARAGFIYLKVYLNLYASGEGILVDIKPVIS